MTANTEIVSSRLVHSLWRGDCGAHVGTGPPLRPLVSGP